MTILITEIEAAQWEESALDPDAAVTGDDCVQQEIELLFATPPGSIPGDPQKGIDMERIVDKPIGVAIPLIVKEAMAKIPAYIPRIVPEAITVARAASDAGDWTIRIAWHYADTKKPGLTEIVR